MKNEHEFESGLFGIKSRRIDIKIKAQGDWLAPSGDPPTELSLYEDICLS